MIARILLSAILTLSLALQGHPSLRSSRAQDAIELGIPVSWSILICTLDERKASFDNLYTNLCAQIAELGLQDVIEILWFCDNRQYSIGYKRNALLQAAQGAYLNFLDDDDAVHAHYIKMIYECLLKTPDVVSLTGIITWNGKNPRYFIHSLRYTSYFEKGGIYYRPPNHLNTMRSDVAKQFPFPDKNHGEDYDWAMQVCRSGLLKTEQIIKKPYYFYMYWEK